jgi:predicted transcriptional regulator YheO
MSKEDSLLKLIKYQNSKSTRKRQFPNEKLGVGDRLILNRLIRQQSEIFEQEFPNQVLIACSTQSHAILEDMRDHGFSPIKLAVNKYRRFIDISQITKKMLEKEDFYTRDGLMNKSNHYQKP